MKHLLARWEKVKDGFEGRNVHLFWDHDGISPARVKSLGSQAFAATTVLSPSFRSSPTYHAK